MGNTEIKVRTLNVNDMFFMARLLLKVGDDLKDDLTALLSSAAKKGKKVKDAKGSDETLEGEVGLALAWKVLSACLEHAEKDLKEWLASLVNKTSEEFGEMPIDTSLVVIDQLMEQENLANFFSGVSALYSKMNKFAGRTTKK